MTVTGTIKLAVPTLRKPGYKSRNRRQLYKLRSKDWHWRDDLISGEYEACEQFLVSALDISRETGENRLTGYSLNLLGKLALEQQDFAKSRLYYQEGLLLWGEMGSKGMVAEILTGLSLLRSLQAEV